MKKLISVLLTLCFWCYMALLLYFLFFSERYGRTVHYTEYQYNFQLFHEIDRYIQYRLRVGSEYFLINVVGNVAAFIPFGFLVPVIMREQKKQRTVNGRYFRYFFLVTFLGFLFSLAVETVQLLTKVGCFDVDDLFLNTVGVVIGYVGYIIAKKVIGHIGKRDEKGRLS